MTLDFYCSGAEDVCKKLESDPIKGLSAKGLKETDTTNSRKRNTQVCW